MSILFLNAHESRLVLQGNVWDPRYRSWHASADPDVAIDWSDVLEEDAGAGGDGDESPHTAATGSPADKPEGASTDKGPPAGDTAPRRRNSRLLVNVASRYWSRSSRRIVLLVGRKAGLQVLLGVGNCQTVGQRREKGTTTVELTDWRVFGESVDVASALAHVPTANRHVVARVLLEEDARALPKAARLAFDEAIRALAPDLELLVADLPRSRHDGFRSQPLSCRPGMPSSPPCASSPRSGAHSSRSSTPKAPPRLRASWSRTCSAPRTRQPPMTQVLSSTGRRKAALVVAGTSSVRTSVNCS